jgi:hypothetical protein
VPAQWQGSIRIPERELTVVLDLAQGKGVWIGSIVVPGLNIQGAPLTAVTFKNSQLTFGIKGSLGPTEFDGHFSANGNLTGDFTQAGNRAPFTLQKTGPPQVQLPPRSTSIAKDLEGEWKGEYELFGYARHVTVKLANSGAEGATAEFMVVGRKTTNVPVDLVTEEGDLLTITSHEMGITYEGRFQKDSGEIHGTFNQGPLELPLVLQRVK